MSKGSEKKATSRLKPELQAVVLADNVYTDVHTNKKIVAGTFNQLWSDRFPATLSKITQAYLVLTNCHGVQNLRIRYVDLKDESVLLESPEIKLTINDPLERHEVVMDVPPLPMPHEGEYDFQVYCDGNKIGHIQVSVGKSRAPRSKK